MAPILDRRFALKKPSVDRRRRGWKTTTPAAPRNRMPRPPKPRGTASVARSRRSRNRSSDAPNGRFLFCDPTYYLHPTHFPIFTLLRCCRPRRKAAHFKHLIGCTDQRVVGYPLGCDFAPRAVPNFGFCSLQAATSCGSICGKGLVACCRCGVPCMIGRMQSATIPTPFLAPRTEKPACLHATVIWAQGRPPFDAG